MNECVGGAGMLSRSVLTTKRRRNSQQGERTMHATIHWAIKSSMVGCQRTVRVTRLGTKLETWWRLNNTGKKIGSGKPAARTNQPWKMDRTFGLVS